MRGTKYCMQCLFLAIKSRDLWVPIYMYILRGQSQCFEKVSIVALNYTCISKRGLFDRLKRPANVEW